MYAEERHRQILQACASDGRVAVSELAARFDVATETIRRDLDALDHRGLLTRVHGGAIPRGDGDIEPDLRTRLTRNTEAKRRIAAAAAAYLPSDPDASIMLDAGSTTVELVPHLVGRGLRVATHGLDIAQALLDADVQPVDILPGRLRGRTHAAVGAQTVQALSRLHPDVAFLGCNGMGAAGFTTPDLDEAAAKSAMVAQAARRVVVADASKAGRTQFVTFAELADIDVLVTDTALPAASLQLFEDSGIEVVRA